MWTLAPCRRNSRSMKSELLTYCSANTGSISRPTTAADWLTHRLKPDAAALQDEKDQIDAKQQAIDAIQKTLDNLH